LQNAQFDYKTKDIQKGLILIFVLVKKRVSLCNFALLKQLIL